MINIKRKQRQGFGSFGKEKITLLEGTIISSFFPETKKITIKDIMERTDYSYERINSSLKSLAKKDIIREESIGKTLVYSLNLQHLYTRIGFNFYMLQREIDFMKKHKVLYNAIKEIRDNPYIWAVILFGSYSKGMETKKSDVDIICISNKKDEMEHFVKSLKYKYNLNFSPVLLPLHEFPNIKSNNPELWEDLKNYGIVFKGEDDLYSWICEDDKH
ncbi:nucleotidyltransferase domain-containing protein [Candidatus Pacearchaeota archaeon]|nr:nucleotidyltransferase domain-containing protein [Candidatus Pacearchaeota archaeon]